MKNRNDFWKLFGASIIMALMMLASIKSGYGQPIHPIPPENNAFNEYDDIDYNDDGGITLNKISFGANSLTQLKEIFRKADIVTAFSMENKIDVSKTIGVVNGYEFNIITKYRLTTKEHVTVIYSMLIINNIKSIKKLRDVNHNIISLMSSKTFTEILTTKRDEYYKRVAEYEKELAIYEKELTIYNSKMLELDAKLDSLLTNKCNLFK